MIERIEDKARVGVCLDTCHIFAAGYELRTPEGVAETLRQFDRVVGLDKLCVIHANDSKTKFGARRDRHEHIGRGMIGEAGFAALLRDERLRKVPFILETPKDNDPDDDLANLATLRRLAGGE
jgi:deoxyribonuclease-4